MLPLALGVEPRYCPGSDVSFWLSEAPLASARVGSEIKIVRPGALNAPSCEIGPELRGAGRLSQGGNAGSGRGYRSSSSGRA
jgi:hypothetical protein